MVRPEETLARLGGDEFALVQPGLAGPDGAAVLARRLIDTLTAPFAFGVRRRRTISASVGVAVSLDGTEHEDELIRQAEWRSIGPSRTAEAGSACSSQEMDAEVQARQTRAGAAGRARARRVRASLPAATRPENAPRG